MELFFVGVTLTPKGVILTFFSSRGVNLTPKLELFCGSYYNSQTGVKFNSFVELYSSLTLQGELNELHFWSHFWGVSITPVGKKMWSNFNSPRRVKTTLLWELFSRSYFNSARGVKCTPFLE